MTDTDAFRDWLRERMAALELKPADLAAMGVASPSNARNWYIGANTPDWHSCYRLATALGVSREEVRRRAGFVDPDEGEVTPSDEAKAALDAVWPDLDPDDRQMLLRLAGLQFGSRRRRARAEQSGR